MFCWDPEWRSRHWLCAAIAPFWFSTEHLSISLMPFWLSTDNITFKFHVYVFFVFDFVLSCLIFFYWFKHIGCISECHNYYTVTKRIGRQEHWRKNMAAMPFWLSTGIELAPFCFLKWLCMQMHSHRAVRAFFISIPVHQK